MKKFIGDKYMKKLKIIIASLVSAILIPAMLFAWGPNRPTYTMEAPSDHVTFNSITNNPNVGDERNFVGIRESGSTSSWSDDVTVEKGKKYTVRMYVHNNAAANLNLVAENVTAFISMPTSPTKSANIEGYIDSSNATPTNIYDNATFTSNDEFSLVYTSDSAKYYNNYFGANGTALSTDLFKSPGTLLGYDKLDGKIPGCLQYDGFVMFDVTPQFTKDISLKIDKQVRLAGTSDWKESIAINPGDTVEYQVQYTNTSSDTNEYNVTINDTLPAHMTYVTGSTKLKNTNFPDWKTVSDNLPGIGINIGSYRPGSTAYLQFSAKADTPISEYACGTNSLVNKAKGTVNSVSSEDTATVTVTKTCVQPPKECKPGIPEGDVRCNPVTPPELPHTGPTEDILSILGLGAMVASIGYYLASRRKSLNR
ncbi:MAG: LPXTG cell wall anchor domain-containing protein [Candidatus Saccharibacteria bacterium]